MATDPPNEASGPWATGPSGLPWGPVTTAYIYITTHTTLSGGLPFADLHLRSR